MTNSQHMVCRYRYDALDGLVGLETGKTGVQRFYRHRDLVTELQGQESQSVFQQDDQPLAVQSHAGNKLVSRLLVTDHQRSVLQLSDPAGLLSLVYTAYGHCPADSGFNSLLNFNGERRDSLTGHYLLGNGHRTFNPLLMRFNSPDRLSPFGRGGLNAYAYCLGDPVNFRDPTGQSIEIARIFVSGLGVQNAGLSMLPSVSFLLGLKAVRRGAGGLVPFKYSAGALGSTVAGITTMISALTGVGGAVAAMTGDTETAQTLGFIALGLAAVTVTAKSVSYWSARDPRTIPALKSFVEGHKRPMATPSPASARRPASPVASAPLPTPMAMPSPETGRGIKRKYDVFDTDSLESTPQARNKLVAQRKNIRSM